MQNRTFGPYLAAINRILIPVMRRNSPCPQVKARGLVLRWDTLSRRKSVTQTIYGAGKRHKAVASYDTKLVRSCDGLTD
jgi:hypothetical protein